MLRAAFNRIAIEFCFCKTSSAIKSFFLKHQGFAMSIYALNELTPTLAPTAWVADEAVVIGNVQLDAGASVWFGAVLRGDNELIHIGENSNVQDGAVLHTDMGFPMTIAANVTIGHQAMLHGCTVGEGSLIGIQAIILNGAVIGKNCLVAAGAVVKENANFPDGSLIVGAPAEAKRTMTPEQQAKLSRNTGFYVKNAERFASGLRKIA
jgi:carbonic anhydrase/acetyltransferase-like protein (isoleucine patch superfamily)